jgi:putative transposase
VLGFKSVAGARAILGSVEMIGMMRKHQGRYAFNPRPSIAEQIDLLAA